jgi:hypothetical protein
MRGIQLTDFDLFVDVVRDSSGRITSGLVVGDILYQNQALILAFNKGDLKADVSVGVGIGRMVLDNERLTWQREIQEQLEMDGQKVESIKITDKSIYIKATY